MRTLLLSAVLVALPALALAQAPSTTPSEATVPTKDWEFVKNAAHGNLAEVEMGKLAQQKATTPAVKDFGARLVTDHGKAYEELKQVASAKGITVPDAPTDKQRKASAKFEAMTGAKFDKAFMSHMVDDHQKDIRAYEKEAKSGKDAEVKAYAMRQLPTLKQHLALAKEARKAAKAAS